MVAWSWSCSPCPVCTDYSTTGCFPSLARLDYRCSGSLDSIRHFRKSAYASSTAPDCSRRCRLPARWSAELGFLHHLQLNHVPQISQVQAQYSGMISVGEIGDWTTDFLRFSCFFFGSCHRLYYRSHLLTGALALVFAPQSAEVLLRSILLEPPDNLVWKARARDLGHDRYAEESFCFHLAFGFLRTWNSLALSPCQGCNDQECSPPPSQYCSFPSGSPPKCSRADFVHRGPSVAKFAPLLRSFWIESCHSSTCFFPLGTFRGQIYFFKRSNFTFQGGATKATF